MADIFDRIYSEDIIKSINEELKMLVDHITGAYLIKYKNSNLTMFNDSKGNKTIYVKNNLFFKDDHDVSYDIPKGKYVKSDDGKIILNSYTEEDVL